jgi:hypothetical protein
MIGDMLSTCNRGHDGVDRDGLGPALLRQRPGQAYDRHLAHRPRRQPEWQEVADMADETRTPLMLSRREVLAVLAGTGAAALLGPLAGSAGAQALKKGGQVVVGLSQEPTAFNPLRPGIEVDRGVHYALYDSLWRVDERAQFVPNLAAELPTQKNGGISPASPGTTAGSSRRAT